MMQVYKDVNGGGCVCERGGGRRKWVDITDLDLRLSCLLKAQEVVIQCVNGLHQLLTVLSPSN